MDIRHGKSLIIAGALLMAGTVGGYSLASYAVGGPTPATGASWVADEAQSYEEPSVASMSIADGPRDYVCRGCGPTLADRRMQKDLADAGYAPDGYPDSPDAYSDGYEALPAYRSTGVAEIDEPAMVDRPSY